MRAARESGEWAKVELFGHGVMVGRVRPSKGYISPGFLVVEVPAVEGIEAFSQFVNHSAIYRITPLSEDVAVAMIHHLRATPYGWSDLPPVVLFEMHDTSTDLPF